MKYIIISGKGGVSEVEWGGVHVSQLYLSRPTTLAEHHKQDLWQEAEQDEQDDDQPGRHGAQHVGKHKVQTLLLQERPAGERTLWFTLTERATGIKEKIKRSVRIAT